MRSEPVRGVIPEPSFFAQPGIEQLRAFTQHHRPGTPHAHLLGYRVTQVSSGTTVVHQPISPWLQVNGNFVDLTTTAHISIFTAALTAAPAATHLRVVNLSLRYLRACTVEEKAVVARGRVLHVGSAVTTVECLIEDSLGRAVAHATGSVVARPIEPPPVAPADGRPPEPGPSYASPDPPNRPLPPYDPEPIFGVPLIEGLKSDSTLRIPFARLLDARVVDVKEGRVAVALPTSQWFCNLYNEVVEAILGVLCSIDGGLAAMSLAQADQRLVLVDQTCTLLRPVVPDGRDVVAVATVSGSPEGVLVGTIEVLDADQRSVMAAHAAGMLVARRRNGSARRVKRVLLTVLFTDLVGSTLRATELGDEAWSELLQKHHTIVRHHLELNEGQEVKTLGDGFFATFDSPTHAVRCARAIRGGLEHLGLTIRAGIHTGECDLDTHDVTGIAVHVAARLEDRAQPGEILVSSIVRDMVQPSGIGLAERGTVSLKGLPGDWPVFAVD